MEDFDYDISEFMSLNDTDELEIKFEVSFTYAYVYTIDFEITIGTESMTNEEGRTSNVSSIEICLSKKKGK